MEPCDAVVFDIDGVLATSWRPIDGASDAVAAVRASGRPVRFVTNTTSRSATAILEALGSGGVTVEADELITAAVATGRYVAADHPGATALVLNDGSDDDLLRHGVTVAETDRADVVIVGSGGPSLTWERLNLALRSLLEGAALVGMTGGTTWQTEDGPCVDGGAYLALLASAAGCEPVVVGKPSATMFEVACAAMGADPKRALMVGDDLAGDIEGAQRCGMQAALVRTGKFRPTDLDHPTITPDAVLDSVADLPALLGV
jgi:HAD superfamily hydrolase (TIGR01458 family)